MSVATEPRTDRACASCGAPLGAGQAWCLECGTAAPEPGGAGRWAAPAAVLAVVVVLAGAGIAFAWAALSSDPPPARRVATGSPPTTPTTPAATTPAPTAPTATSTTPAPSTIPGAASPGDVRPDAKPGAAPAGSPPGRIGTWPAGRRAYTVVLLSATSRGAARKVAGRLASQGVDVGILDSADYPSLAPGYFVVFSGRFADVGAAQQAAQRLAAQAPGAYAKLVSPR